MNIEKRGEYKGYKYLVVAHEMGHRCGYIKIPRKNKFYGKNYEEIPIAVHGGLTFSKRRGGFGRGWWIGFDCAHFGDKPDKSIMSEEYKEVYLKYPHLGLNKEGQVRNSSYVEKECKSAIKEIIKLNK